MNTIFCLDDDHGMLNLYEDILSTRYHVVAFDEGVELIREFKESPANLVILDYNVPGMSGLEVCCELRKLPQSRDVPIMMVSAVDVEETISKSLASGADDYIIKPFRPAEILAKVGNVLERYSAGMMLPPSSIYHDRYKILRILGSGSYSSVYCAHDTSYDPPVEVAVKIFNPEKKRQSATRFETFFLREAYEWSKLDHPNIVKLSNFGENAGLYFLVIEFFDGRELWRHVQENGPLDEGFLIFMVHELVKALEHMALFKIIHRDIKPQNILFNDERMVKLTDFGLAKQRDESNLTIDGVRFKGTPAFASPEQIQAHKYVDIRSDIYSLGATLYYAATGISPFEGANITETANNHMNKTPDPVYMENPAISRRFSDLIGEMLKKNMSERIRLADLKRITLELLAPNGEPSESVAE